MKTNFNRQRPARGFTLVECLIYISVSAVVLGIGSVAFYRCWDDNKNITRNGNEIVQTLKAGENWRTDMRSATGPIKLSTTNAQQTISIPCGQQVVTYSFDNGEVRKQTVKNGSWNVVIQKVKSSQMETDKRDLVTAWRWDVELVSQRKNAKVRPLFTFEVVAGNSSTP
jgi:Tfp pilus assembly protein FimT